MEALLSEVWLFHPGIRNEMKLVLNKVMVMITTPKKTLQGSRSEWVKVLSVTNQVARKKTICFPILEGAVERISWDLTV